MKPIGVSALEFMSFFTKYIEKVDITMKESFVDTEICWDQMQNGYEGHYLKFERNGEIKGLLLINMDHNCQTEFRAYIRHLTVIDKNDFN